LEGALIFGLEPLRSPAIPFFQELDRPIKIQAGEGVTEAVKGGVKAVFTGIVRVTQGDFTLMCDRLEIVFGDGSPVSASRGGTSARPKASIALDKMRSFTASGNVKMVDKLIMGTAEKVIYDHVNRTLRLIEGPPRIWQGQDMAVAGEIVINLDENRPHLKRGILP
jgi:lipopolysaccharide export system protein LptA